MKVIRSACVSLVVCVLSAGVAGCAAESVSYPTLSTVKNIKNRILSREEQEEVIRDLSAERAEQESDTGKAEEKSQ